MAIYQFKIELIPHAWLKNTKSSADAINKIFSGENYDSSIVWNNYKFNKLIVDDINKILTKNESWNKDLRIWGNEAESDIQIWLEKDCIESFQIRIDLRNENIFLIKKILDFAKKYEFCILSMDEKLILNPDFDSLLSCVEKSKAKIFLGNPEKFFEDKK